MVCVFIDFKSAYNTIKKTKLFEILRKLNFYEEQEIVFLQRLYENTFFQSGDKYIRIQEGVNQGSPLSPGFFDIYFEEFLRVWKTRINNQLIWYRGYADDLVFIQSEREFHRTFPIFQELSLEFNLVINKKKSGIFFIGSREVQLE